MLKPFLKWAGGKTWLVSRYDQIAPIQFNRYIEPFLGSGAVFFHLNPTTAILADKNVSLIDTYKAIRHHPKQIDAYLAEYHSLHNSEFYYAMRETKGRDSVERAAIFIYLNRVCFNGLYRVNQQGCFNVPVGSKSEVRYAAGYLYEVSVRLKRAQLIASDFESTIDTATEGDFLYVDPPYTVSHNNNGFIKYNNVLFSWDDQIRLAGAVTRAIKRGVFVFVSNADHNAVHELYTEFDYHHKLSRTSILSAKAEARKPTSEAAFLNYRVPKFST